MIPGEVRALVAQALGWIGQPMADVLRLTNAGLSLVWIASCVYAIVLSQHSDQRVRFGIFGLLGFLLTAGHLRSLGIPGPWTLPALTLVVAAGIWSTIKYVRRELKERRRGTG